MNCVCHTSNTATAELGNTSPSLSRMQWRQYLIWIRLICTDPSQNSNSQPNSQTNSQNSNSQNSNSQNLLPTTIKKDLQHKNQENKNQLDDEDKGAI